jgi:cytochrome b561
MGLGRKGDRYGAVAILFHWTVAALILFNIWLGWRFEDLHGPAKLALIQTHKAIGITVLVLSVLRLGWRLIHRPPPFSAHLAPWERALAHAVHWTFYIFMIGMPLTGWAMVSASRRIKVFPIDMFGLFHWPAIGPLTNLPADQMKATHEALEFIHTGPLLWLGYGLIVLHVVGALKHQLIDRDNELARMVPFFGKPGRKGAVS